MSKVEKKNRERVYFGGISFKLNAPASHVTTGKDFVTSGSSEKLSFDGRLCIPRLTNLISSVDVTQDFFRLKLNVQVCRTFLR